MICCFSCGDPATHRKRHDDFSSGEIEMIPYCDECDKIMREILNNDTSHGQAERWTHWLGHLAGKPGLSFLEIGSYEGQSAIWFCRNLMTGLGSTLTCVDTWAAGEDMPLVTDDSLLETFRKNTAPWKDRIIECRGRSEDKLWMFARDYFDFIYVDGSHTSASVLSDAIMAWRLLKPSGIMIFDDYLWELPIEVYPTPLTEEQKQNQSLIRPKLGIDAFLACYRGRYEVIAQEWQVALKKLNA